MELESPSGLVHAFLGLIDGRPAYRLDYRGERVLDDSFFWIDFKEGGFLGDGIRIVDEQISDHDETYAVLVGKTSQARNRYREARISLEESKAPHRHLVAAMRAYDDGFAIRFEIPSQDSIGDFELLDERFEFRFPDNHRCWASTLTDFHSSFEAEYPSRRLSDLKPGSLHGLPVVVEAKSCLAAIGEANVRDHAGIYIEGRSGVANALVTKPSPLHRADSIGISRSKAPHTSPWRFVMLADTPGGLIESNLMHNLSDPCAVEDTTWIKPGKVTWDWWCGPVAPGRPFQPGMNDPTFHYFIDFAADLGLEYCMIDGGWYQDGDVMRSQDTLHVPELIRYAKDKKVGILLWMHSAHLSPVLDRAFAWYEEIGAKGVKIDFFDRNDQDTHLYIERILRTAERHRLMVNLHGVFNPTGIERTYPHLMTAEGVLGAEYNKWSRRVTPEHNLTLPFTRMLMGPMDYTAGVFTNVTQKEFVPRNEHPMAVGTRAHHLAMYVVYQSGWQMVSDYPDAIRHQPGSEFIRVVPTIWDETRVLDGEIGRFIIVARRSGDRWYVGGMTVEPWTCAFDLDFLKSSATIELYRDAADSEIHPTHLTIEKRTVQPGETVRIEMAAAGGFAAIL